MRPCSHFDYTIYFNIIWKVKVKQGMCDQMQKCQTCQFPVFSKVSQVAHFFGKHILMDKTLQWTSLTIHRLKNRYTIVNYDKILIAKINSKKNLDLFGSISESCSYIFVNVPRLY